MERVVESRRTRKGRTECKLDYARRNKCNDVRIHVEQENLVRRNVYYAPVVLDFYYELFVSLHAGSQKNLQSADRAKQMKIQILNI